MITKGPHVAQQRMSRESTPVLSGAVPLFEMFMSQWEYVRDHHEETRSWVDVGLTWAKKYYRRMDHTKAYIIAMCELALSLLFLR